MIGKDLTGKRMMFDYHPVESQCPECGYICCSEFPPQVKVVTVLYRSYAHHCRKCWNLTETPEGWWVIDNGVGDNGICTAPYTLLRELDAE